jgi:hypothetical protein
LTASVSATSPAGLNFSRFDDGSTMVAVGDTAVHLTAYQAEALTRYLMAFKSPRWAPLVKRLREAANPDCWSAAVAIEMLEERVRVRDEMVQILNDMVEKEKKKP